MLSFFQKPTFNLTQLLVTAQKITTPTCYVRQFSISNTHWCTANEEVSSDPIVQRSEDIELTAEEIRKQSLDRTKVIPVETSIKYLKSAAYQETYGNYLVWQQYRRNHKGLFAPLKTRKTCIRQGKISCGNPCPICRDEYLVLDHRNLDLIKQFISPQTGEVLSYSKTGLCQKKHFDLLVAVERAMDYGLLTFDVPFRKFDYTEYYSHLKANQAV